MKITLELLKKYNTKKAHIEYLEGEGLIGKELIDLIDYEVPVEILFHLRKYLKFDEEEEKAYNSFCHIESSSNIWNSISVKDSHDLMNSSFVENSTRVRNSRSVVDSICVYDSTKVRSSGDVVFSNEVYDSDMVLNSTRVFESEQVARSEDIVWSSNVFRSKNVRDSSFIYQSENIEDCDFCGFMKNSNHCMFSTNLEGKEYYIFNEKVSPQEFTQFKEALRERLATELPHMIIAESDGEGGTRYVFAPRYDSVFNGLSKEFYGWVGTLPNYSDEKFIELFFKENET